MKRSVEMIRLGTPEPRIHSLRVKNYRALRDIHLKNLSRMTVLLGPNGSGKSTVLDVMTFLSECFTRGLRFAWDKRQGSRELKTRGAKGPIEIEIKYKERPTDPFITYHIAIDEDEYDSGPVVVFETLKWQRKVPGAPFAFLNFKNGKGVVIAGEDPDELGDRTNEELAAPDMLAVNTFGQLSRFPRIRELRRFITGWYLEALSVEAMRGLPKAGPQVRLSPTGDNLANVIQYLGEREPERLHSIMNALRKRVPHLADVFTEEVGDGRLLLQLKDGPFDRPFLAKFMSDGTLETLAYLVLLRHPVPPPFIGVDEPEIHVHPRLLLGIAEECRKASANSQLLIATHSPIFVNGLRPEEVWILYRNQRGYTEAKRAADITGIPEFTEHGGLLGDLWLEGQFRVGDPLKLDAHSQMPRSPHRSEGTNAN